MFCLSLSCFLLLLFCFTSISDISDVSSYQVPYAGSYSSTCRVNFEVTSAEVIKNAPSTSVLSCHSGHVVSCLLSFCLSMEAK